MAPLHPIAHHCHRPRPHVTSARHPRAQGAVIGSLCLCGVLWLAYKYCADRSHASGWGESSLYPPSTRATRRKKRSARVAAIIAEGNAAKEATVGGAVGGAAGSDAEGGVTWEVESPSPDAKGTAEGRAAVAAVTAADVAQARSMETALVEDEDGAHRHRCGAAPVARVERVEKRFDDRHRRARVAPVPKFSPDPPPPRSPYTGAPLPPMTSYEGPYCAASRGATWKPPPIQHAPTPKAPPVLAAEAAAIAGPGPRSGGKSGFVDRAPKEMRSGISARAPPAPEAGPAPWIPLKYHQRQTAPPPLGVPRKVAASRRTIAPTGPTPPPTPPPRRFTDADPPGSRSGSRVESLPGSAAPTPRSARGRTRGNFAPGSAREIARERRRSREFLATAHARPVPSLPTSPQGSAGISQLSPSRTGSWRRNLSVAVPPSAFAAENDAEPPPMRDSSMGAAERVRARRARRYDMEARAAQLAGPVEIQRATSAEMIAGTRHAGFAIRSPGTPLERARSRSRSGSRLGF